MSELQGERTVSPINIKVPKGDLRTFYYMLLTNDMDHFLRLTHGLPDTVLGIACMDDVTIPRANTTLAQVAQYYLHNAKKPTNCRLLSEVANSSKLPEQRLLSNLVSLEQVKGERNTQHFLGPLTNNQQQIALRTDPFILINPLHPLAGELGATTLPIRKERVTFDVAPGWKPMRFLNEGRHSKAILVVNGAKSKVGCLKISRLEYDDPVDQRIGNEAKILENIQNSYGQIPGIVKIYERGERWNVLEYLPGYSVDQLLPLFPVALTHEGSERELRRTVAINIIEAIVALYKVGVAHGDLKLENVMLEITPDGPKGTIVDFEMAKQNIDQGYEVARVRDLYTTLEIVYEILAGEPPFGKTKNELQIRLIKLGVNRPVSEGIAEGIIDQRGFGGFTDVRSYESIQQYLQPDHPAMTCYLLGSKP